MRTQRRSHSDGIQPFVDPVDRQVERRHTDPVQRLAVCHHVFSRFDWTICIRAVSTMTMLDAPVVYSAVETSDFESIVPEDAACIKARHTLPSEPLN
jgi:hypothetical protein